jgi:hypothetical protein
MNEVSQSETSFMPFNVRIHAKVFLGLFGEAPPPQTIPVPSLKIYFQVRSVHVTFSRTKSACTD